jgi:hypothetical protein
VRPCGHAAVRPCQGRPCGGLPPHLQLNAVVHARSPAPSERSEPVTLQDRRSDTASITGGSRFAVCDEKRKCRTAQAVRHFAVDNCLRVLRYAVGCPPLLPLGGRGRRWHPGRSAPRKFSTFEDQHLGRSEDQHLGRSASRTMSSRRPAPWKINSESGLTASPAPEAWRRTRAGQLRPKSWVQYGVPLLVRATPTPMAALAQFRMLRRCPVLFIQAVTTCCGVW